MTRIGTIGLGTVGMPLAVALAMASLDRPTSGVVRAMDDVPRLRQAGVR